MLVDIGFWNNKGEYIEDFQEVGEDEIMSALSIDDLNNLENTLKQNEALRTQNKGFQKVFMKILALCDEQADNMAVVEFQKRVKEILSE